MAAVRHLGFYTFAYFCPVALVGMPFCFLVQNFAENGQSVDHLKMCSFCHVALVDLPFCFLIQNFAEIGQSEIGRAHV